MKKHEGFWKAHAFELALLVLVLFLTGLLLHMNSRLLKMSTVLESKIHRVDRAIWDLNAQVDERFNVLDENLVKRLSTVNRGVASLERPVFRTKKDNVDATKGGEGDHVGSDIGLNLRTVAGPEIENLALNWGILRRAFPRRLQDSKRAYLDLINQLGFPVTEQQRIQLRNVVHETFGLVECITTSAGWEE
ncbi:MAG: hypothetical protein JRG79_00280 [Deltaproteobacteria bacterium]|nr:hypothetical protein [Deltaproteobacteria bacterium]